jgi:hypothetical protein
LHKSARVWARDENLRIKSLNFTFFLIGFSFEKQKMKKCPQCNRTFPDDTLAFCLEDGTLLSAPYYPQQTPAPTVAVNAFETPTVVAREIPTVAAGNNVPTYANTPRPTEQASKKGAGWKAYLAGLLISLVFDLIYFYGLYPYYGEATQEFFFAIAEKFDEPSVGYLIAGLIITTPINMFVYSVLAFLLGVIWWRGKWKWGVIALLPNFGFTIYYFVINISDDHQAVYIIRIFIANILYLSVTCLSAAIGSWISKSIFGKKTEART